MSKYSDGNSFQLLYNHMVHPPAMWYSPPMRTAAKRRKRTWKQVAARQSRLICLNNLVMCLPNIIPVIYPTGSRTGHFSPELDVGFSPAVTSEATRNEAVMLAELATWLSWMPTFSNFDAFVSAVFNSWVWCGRRGGRAEDGGNVLQSAGLAHVFSFTLSLSAVFDLFFSPCDLPFLLLLHTDFTRNFLQPPHLDSHPTLFSLPLLTYSHLSEASPACPSHILYI